MKRLRRASGFQGLSTAYLASAATDPMCGELKGVTNLPLVSLIITCRNEKDFIGSCLDSILTNGYPHDRMEVLVVDGMSEDGTREIVRRYAGACPCVVLVDNPERITPCALNIGIRRARGEFIMWMSAHASYRKGYIRACVTASLQYGADNVGGMTNTVPRRSTRTAHAITATFNHPLGAGNARYRLGAREATWVDTVFGGCYRREVFSKVGLFNEALVRSQDIEFNLRLKRAGGRTLMVPSAVADYYIRSDLRSFARHNWVNGVWAILPFAYSDIVPISWRHVVPLGFALSLVATGLLTALIPSWGWPFYVVVGMYVLATVAASVQVAWQRRDPWMLLLMPVAFAALHLPYGFGSLWGLAKTGWLFLTGRATRGRSDRVAKASL